MAPERTQGQQLEAGVSVSCSLPELGSGRPGGQWGEELLSPDIPLSCPTGPGGAAQGWGELALGAEPPLEDAETPAPSPPPPCSLAFGDGGAPWLPLRATVPPLASRSKFAGSKKFLG